MPQEHSTEEVANQGQVIMVPLELEGLRLLKQEMQPDGTIRHTPVRLGCPPGARGECWAQAKRHLFLRNREDHAARGGTEQSQLSSRLS